VFGFFNIHGNLALEKSTSSVTLGDSVVDATGTITKPASQVTVNMLTIGGSGLDAFVGIGGGYDTSGKLNSGATGLSLSGVEFGLAMAGEQLTGLEPTGYQLRKWTSLQAMVGSAAFIGVDGLTIAADTLSVEINRAAIDGTLADYKAQNLAINTGTTAEPGSLALTMDASEGQLLRATGNLNLDVYGLLKVSGGFGIEKKRGQVTLADITGTTENEAATPVTVDMLLLGASGLDAFIGVGDIGLQLGEVNVGLAMIGEQLTPTEISGGKVARKWTTLQAEVGSAAFVGIEGLTIGADTFSVAVNRQALDRSVIDYSLKSGSAIDRKTDLTILTGPASDMALTIDGSFGQYTKASGHLVLDLFGFVQVEGEFAIEKASAPVTLMLSDGQSAKAEVLKIGATKLNAFAGINGGTTDAIGLQLVGVEFGLAMMSEVVAAGSTAAGRSWTSLQATATSAAFVGVEGLTAKADTISIEVNRAGKESDAVVDYSYKSGSSGDRKTSLEISTGIASTLALSMDGTEGRLLRASANLELDAFGFMQVSGGFALEKRTESFYLNDGVASDDPTKAKAPTQITAQLLTIGGSGIDAFVGMNGGTTDAIGLSLGSVDFGLAMISEVLPEGSAAGTTARKFTTLKATAGSVGFVGIENLSISATDLSVEINRGIAGTAGASDLVVDYSGRQLEVLAGPNVTVTLDSEGSLGELTRASGNLNLNLFNFVMLSGYLTFESSSKTINLTGSNASTAGESVNTKLLAIGGQGVSTFVGVNGGSDQAIGLSLENTTFALALMSSKTDTTRSWTSLQASAESLSMIGIEGLTASATAITLSINQAGKVGDAVVDYAGTNATDLSIKTSTSSTLKLSLEGSEGETIKAAANLDIDLFGFFSVKGGFAVEQRSQSVTLSDGSVIDKAQLITIGGNEVNAFAGVNGGYDATTGLLSSNAMGLSLGSVNFGLALISDPTNTTRSFTSLQATAGNAAVVGIEGLTMQVQNMLVNINHGISLQAEAAKTIKVNTKLQLSLPLNMIGTLTLNRAAGAGYAADSATVTIGSATTNAELITVLQSAIESLDGIGAGNVTISGNRYDGYQIEFFGTLSGIAVTDITASATGATVLYKQSTTATANAGVSEVKQVTLQALREAPAPVTVTTGTSTQGLSGTNESNAIIFTSPQSAGSFTVYLVTDGLVAQTATGVSGISEVQRLTLLGDTTAQSGSVTTSVTTVTEGSSSASINERYKVTFLNNFGYTGFKLFFMETPTAATATWKYSSHNEDAAATISQLKSAYAELLKNSVAGKTITTSDIQVTQDLSYKGTGKSYTVEFTGNLAGVNVKDIGMRGESGKFSNIQLQNGLSGQSEIQRVTLKAASAGSFTLSFTNNGTTWMTDSIAYGSNATTVRTALNTALGTAGSVEVTSAVSGEYLVTFGGKLASTNLSALEVQSVQAAPGGSFTLSFGTQTTASILYTSDGATLAKRVQTALSALSSIGSGNVTVSYNASQSNAGQIGLDIRFSGTLSSSNVSQLSFNQASLANASGSVRTVTAGISNIHQQQEITLGTDAVSKGYTLSLTYLGQTYSTAVIAGTATATQIQSAVNSAFGVISGASFTVSKLYSDTITLTVGGSLGGQNLNLVNVQAEGSTASGSIITKNFVVNNTTQNIANLKSAYAELLGTEQANIDVTFDSSYSQGERYVISFIGALASTNIADKGISISGTTIAYKLLSEGVAATSEIQTIKVDRDSTTEGVFQLSLTQGRKIYTTATIALGADAATVQAALRAAKSSDNSTLSSLGTIMVGGAVDSYTVVFGGALAGTNVAELKVGAVQVNAQLPEGSFQISLDGIITDDIAYSTDNTELASNIQSALEGLANIGSGNVTVTVDTASTAGRKAAFLLTFKNALANLDVANITSHFANLQLAVVTPVNMTQGRAKTGELQQITIESAAKEVVFTLSLTHSTKTATSATLNSAMTLAEVQSAVTSMMSDLNTAIGSGFAATATVIFWSGKDLQIRFGGSFEGVDVADMVVTNVERSYTAAITVAQAGRTIEIAAKPIRSVVVDYSTGATDLTVTTGPTTTLKLKMDGSKGELLQASGALTLDVFGFFAVKGNLAIEKSTQRVTLADLASTTTVDESATLAACRN